MAKFCTKCGAPLENNAAFCTNCGALVDTKNNSVNLHKKSTAILLGGILAGIIIIVILISLIFGGGYKSAIDNYFEGLEDANAKKFMNAMPECQIEYLEKSFEDYDEYDSLKEYFEYLLEVALDEVEDEYGDDISISYEIKDKEELSDKELKDIRKELRSNYDNNDVEVTKGYEVEISAEIKGDDDSDNMDMTLKVAKVDGDWCIVNGGFLPM
ncbi:MAG: zinc ribbon domain-containing protein [Ruminococcus sp.]|nr:zinc ribbon domain-containing protein [Ruminococcus sp.]